MSILSWNYRGNKCFSLASRDGLNIWQIHTLRKYIKKYFPEVVFLMEMKQSKKSLVELQVTLGFDKVFTVEHVGFSGGLALL